MVNRFTGIIRKKYIDYGLFKFRAYRGKGIVYYHGIDLSASTRFNYRFVSLKDFEQQISSFKKFFNVVSVKDYFENNIDPGKFNLAITFDDGYLNNFTHAVPILEKYQVPASIYVTGLNQTPYNILWADLLDIFSQLYPHDTFSFDHIEFRKNARGRFTDIGNYIKKDGTGSYRLKGLLHEVIFNTIPDFRNNPALFDYWKLVPDEELARIASSRFITIGSHGYWHNNLGNISLQNAVTELSASKKYLENLLQYEVAELAYPDGSYTVNVANAARELGFTRQLLCNANTPADLDYPFLAERIEMGVYESPNEKIYQVLDKFSGR